MKNARRAALALLCLLFAGCGGSDAKPQTPGGGAAPLTPVTLQLNWFPEAEHGGYLAAHVLGYYREEGLDVEILPGGPGTPVIQGVASRRIDFAIANADQVLLGRAQQANVVAVMAPLQNTPRCIMVHAESNIHDFQDLKNITLALGDGKAFAEYMKKNLPLENVVFAPYAGSVAQFLLNENYAQQAYVFSEPFVAGKKGAQSRCLMLSDLGFNPYTSILIAHGEAIAEKQDLVERVVRASVRGWQAYLADPAATNAYITKLNPEMDIESLAYGVDAIRPLCTPESGEKSSFGAMTAKRWRTLAEQLVEIGLLKPNAVDPGEAFQNIH